MTTELAKARESVIRAAKAWALARSGREARALDLKLYRALARLERAERKTKC